ncbi:DNA polymerase III subunit delta' [Kushneria pakistanensis]|uniref:DNA polymerase III subunit delta' n=1 Tax=Kushneria pakistanensis TaxID=1508770 RepID=A0ABQ3FDR2_9GAMM|nr:DNA polymerase III subunit delta' [Kushneria pakistanensis]GHC19285.1 DNA polymerase III subunit delta' [Kushneria pakistanensis]
MELTPWPWQASIWQRLIALADESRLPHALMLTGPSGLGKERLAQALIARQLCQAPSNTACGQCHACQMLISGYHPDLLEILPAERGKQIRIDAIRDINAFASQTAQQGGYRIIHLAPAEAMTVAASNALLKSLEEPGNDTLFILQSDIPSRTLPTIRSRCQQWAHPMPAREETLAWLAQELDDQEQAEFWWLVAGGRPLLARDLAMPEARQLRQELRELFESLVRGGDPVAEAGRLDKQALSDILWHGVLWLEDLIRLGVSGDMSSVRNRDLLPLYRQAIKNGRVRDWFRLLDYAHEQRRLLAAGGNPNAQLVIESWLIRWSALLRS